MNLDRKAIIDQLILKTYKMCKITSFPFDCKKVLKAYGYDCKAYSSLNDKKRKICLGVSDDACIMNGTIYYNDTMLQGRIPFTLMHELAHILLEHRIKDEEEEHEADYMASNFLAPRIMIHQLCLSNEYKKITADDIHNYFGISISAANRAVMDYHEWYANIAHTTRKPTDTELKIKELFCIDTTDTKPTVAKKKTRYSKRYEEYARKSILLQQYGYEPAFYSIYDE